MFSRYKIVIALLLLVFAGTTTLPAKEALKNTPNDDVQNAAQSTRKGEELRYIIYNMPVSAAFRMVAKASDANVSISARLTGLIRNVTLSGSTDSMLDQLADLSNSDWFISGSQIFVSSKSERIVRFISLSGNLDGSTALETIRQAGLDTDRFTVAPSISGNMLTVNASPKYVAFIETLLQSQLQQKPKTQAVFKPVECDDNTVKIKVIKFGVRSFAEVSAQSAGRSVADC